MDEVAVSLLAGLKKKAKESGRSYKLCLRSFCQEVFLRRMKTTKYAGNLVLKGGLLVYFLSDFDSRAVKEIDFFLQRVPNSSKKLHALLNAIISNPSRYDFITFKNKPIVPIVRDEECLGVKFPIVAQIQNRRVLFDVNFYLGDPVVPKKERQKLPMQFMDFPVLKIDTAALEEVVAERMESVLSLTTFCERFDDYCDIYYMLNKFSFDGAIVLEALKKTFEKTGQTVTVRYLENLIAMDDDRTMYRRWRFFCRKNGLKTDDYHTVLKTIDDFFVKPIMALEYDKEFDKQWSAADRRWI